MQKIRKVFLLLFVMFSLFILNTNTDVQANEFEDVPDVTVTAPYNP